MFSRRNFIGALAGIPLFLKGEEWSKDNTGGPGIPVEGTVKVFRIKRFEDNLFMITYHIGDEIWNCFVRPKNRTEFLYGGLGVYLKQSPGHWDTILLGRQMKYGDKGKEILIDSCSYSIGKHQGSEVRWRNGKVIPV